MDRLELKGRWDELKGRLKKKYANLTDDDLMYEDGKDEELLGRLEKKTGESRERLIDFIRSL